ncbi:hydroxyphenylacetyl-CoA thioesterase PaaI [Marmoricola sp. RAF53]|uniref:hydroxyphenylacetyl-CoA thioesterase PaaI n=1 Tax=Marmoricola sp. RAF53 TaxID=3233059 RepID=UPI003F988D04
MVSDPNQIAQQNAKAMWATDKASQALGITLEHVGHNFAIARMLVRDDMLNGFGSCHGGFVSCLADTAFAFACNSEGVKTVASGFSIDFIAPVNAGDLLEAVASKTASAGRSGIFDVTVRRAAGHESEIVAVFRGRARSLG